jgi:hypothetical protein
LTSERAPLLRTARRAPARACFFAEAVRLATTDHLVRGQGHESSIIEGLGIRARRQATKGASRRLHCTHCRPHRRR